MNEQISIIIDSIFNSQGFKDATSQLEQLRVGVSKTSTQLQGFNDIVSIGRQAKQIATVNKYLDQFDTKLHATGRIAQKSNGTLRATDEQLQNIANSVARGEWDDFNKDLKKTNKTVQQSAGAFSSFSKQFAAEFLSVMFFGMQIRMQFEKLAKTTIDSFMRITEAMHPTAQAVNALQANMELLKFTIGSAVAGVLEALLPTLIPIINKVADWVDQNKDLVGWIVIIAIVLGTLLFAIGMMFTGIQGIVMVLAKMGTGIGMLISKFGGLTGVTGMWSAIAKVGFATIGIAVIKIIAIVALLYAIWKSNFGGIQEFTKSTFGLIWKTISTLMKDIWDIIVLIMGIIVGVFQGDWEKVGKLTARLVLKLVETVGKLLGGLVLIIMNLGILVNNILSDSLKILTNLFIYTIESWLGLWFTFGEKLITLLQKPLQWIIDKVNQVIMAFSSVPGFHWLANIQIPNVKDTLGTLSSMRSVIKDFGKTARDSVGSFFDDKVKMDFFSTDDLGAWNNLLEQTNKNLSDTMNLNNYSDGLSILPEKAAVVEQTSKSLTEQNIEEAESWDNKTFSISKYADELERVQSITGGSGSNNDMDRWLSNSSTINI